MYISVLRQQESIPAAGILPIHSLDSITNSVSEDSESIKGKKLKINLIHIYNCF